MARRYLDASTVYEKLKELGHDYSPAKQQYKQTISGLYTYVYDSHGNPSEIEAPYVEQHVDRGGMFLTEADWKATQKSEEAAPVAEKKATKKSEG